MKKEILCLAIIMPMLVTATNQNNRQSKLTVRPKTLATEEKTINSNFTTVGGIKIIIGNNSQIQVYSQKYSPTDGVYYNRNYTPISDDLSNSVFLTLDDGSGHITFSNYNEISLKFDNHLTPVDQSDLSGDGSQSNPFQVTTVLKPDNTSFDDVRITLTDTYTIPNPYFDRKIELDNLPTGYTAKLFSQFGPHSNAYCYMQGSAALPDRIGLYVNDLLYSLSAGDPKWNGYSAAEYDKIARDAIRDANSLDNTVCNTLRTNDYAGQWNVPDGQTSYSTTIRLSYTGYQTVLASYQPSIIDLIDDPNQTTSTLTLTVSNVDTANAISSKSFDYTVPDNIEIDPTTETTNCTSATVTTTASLIKVSNIDLDAADSTGATIPASCTITYQVNMLKRGEGKIGSFDSSDFDVLSNGKITFAQASATSGSTVSIPTTGLLGLLILVLASIGFGRYYFKR